MNKENSRTKNSVINSIGAVLSKSANLILSFLLRTIFIRYIGVELLGINGIFTNVLTILSLAELGVGEALIFSMYKPIADKDNEKIKSLMLLYKRAYRYIGISIGILGTILIPFLKYIINSNIPMNEIYIFYILFLANSISSYFFVYKRTIIVASQKNYITNIIDTCCLIMKIIAQVIIIIIFKNYILYLIIQIIYTLTNNIIISYKANKLYPFLKEKEVKKMDQEEKKNIFKNIKSLTIYKIASVVLDGTDNILISSFISTAIVGIFSNYTLIVDSLYGVMQQITDGITSSVGNLVAKENIESQERVFINLTFFNVFIFGIVAVCIFVLINPFIKMIWGEEYLLSELVAFIITINFFIKGLLKATWAYRSTKGLFIYGKYRPIISAIINLIVSIILVRYLGIAGILLGTTITRITTNLWYDPYIIYNKGFKKSVLPYYFKLFKYTITILICYVASKLIIGNIQISNMFLWIMSAMISIVTTSIIITIFYYRSNEFKYFKTKILDIINKIKNKLKNGGK